MNKISSKRLDLKAILSLIEEGSHVLDIGCGDGDLLAYIKEKKDIVAYGIEISDQKIANCISKGLTVVQHDANEGLKDYSDNEFDYVILSQTLQVIQNPDYLINEALRVGRKAIVSIPNFGHWRCRVNVFFRGRVPVTRTLPYEWYNTPNNKVLTIKDFRMFCRKRDIKINKEIPFAVKDTDEGRVLHLFSNLRAQYGIFEIEQKY